MDLIVSILIVLDDALVHLKIKTTHLEVYLVSILIVLDDALVLSQDRMKVISM